MKLEDSWTISGIHYGTGRPVQVKIQGTQIVNVSPYDSADHSDLPFIGPGLVDLQINGYGGRDFNTHPLSVDMVSFVTEQLWQTGVTAYCPTIITNGDQEIEDAARTIAKACDQNTNVEHSVIGIHLEGPFITPEDGPRGAHDRQYVKAPDWNLFQRWQDVAGGRISILTISPEWESAPTFIERCVDNGVIVSIGHTSASPEQIQEAVKAGARLSTHLGNGAHLMLPRHPNYIWEQLAEDSLYACIIADGFHLPDSFIKVALRAKGDRLMLVSDAVSLSGMPPGTYDMHIGGRVQLTEEGRLCVAEQPELLAGSAQMLTWGIGKLVSSGLTDLKNAWDMASIRPARFVDSPHAGELAAGAAADLVLFDMRGKDLTVRQTIKGGQSVFTRA